MKIEQAILKFRSMGFDDWSHIGWRNGRGLYQNGRGAAIIQIHMATTLDLPLTTGLLIYDAEEDPPWTFCETVEGIEEWVLHYFDTIGEEE